MLSCLFLAALWSPAGKALTSWLSFVLCFYFILSLSHTCPDPYQNLGWGLYRQTCLYLLIVPRRWASFVDHLCYVCFTFCFFYAVLSVHCSLLLTCCERADLLALWCVTFSYVFFRFPKQGWYFIESFLFLSLPSSLLFTFLCYSCTYQIRTENAAKHLNINFLWTSLNKMASAVTFEHHSAISVCNVFGNKSTEIISLFFQLDVCNNAISSCKNITIHHESPCWIVHTCGSCKISIPSP